MERVIHQFRLTLGGARPWVVAAVIVAAGLSLYFAAQGVRYFQAAGNNSSVRDQIGRLERATGPQLEGNAEQAARLEATRLRLENLHRLFDYPATDTLMSIVSDIAGDVGLDLVSMTAEEVKVELRGDHQYQVRPISVIVDGPTANVQEFLAVLYDRVPVVVASSARMVNLDTSPSTQLQLRFYLSPEPLPEEGDDTAG
ncbi:MAG: hypothetical protein IH873_00470 [Chloroflexi bacterium]|nr:hypothetical protein [Chloroflexota bacterium]